MEGFSAGGSEDRVARPGDLWLHARAVTGCHVVVPDDAVATFTRKRYRPERFKPVRSLPLFAQWYDTAIKLDTQCCALPSPWS